MIPKVRLTGVRQKGILYERAFGKWLAGEFPDREIRSDQWICFEDKVGKGYACIDHYVVLPHAVLLFECKLTWTKRAWWQLEHRYRPLLREIHQRPVCTIQVCRNLSAPVPARVRRTPRELAEHPEAGRFTFVWRRPLYG